MAEPEGVTFTEEEYLLRERRNLGKSEWINGCIVAMAGASARHNALAARIIASLDRRLESKPCVVLTSDQRIHIPETGLHTYPDAVVVCGGAIFHAKDSQTIVNPLVLIEVLSAETEAYDRGAKFAHC